MVSPDGGSFCVNGGSVLDGLRVLLVNSDSEQLVRTTALLSDVHYDVLPANGLEEASEALCVQKFDVVLLGSRLPADDLEAFALAVQTVDKNQRPPSKTAIVSISGDESSAKAADGASVDAYLPAHFELSSLAEAVSEVRRAQTAKQDVTDPSEDQPPVLDVEEFRAQVGFDDELLVEIIDLFLEERTHQMVEMCEALAAADFKLLGRVAHTIKGSLGSLHAGRSRATSQQLESAAGREDAGLCGQFLQTLEQDLAVLEPELLGLRQLTAAS